MEVLFDFLKSVVCGVGIAAFIWYCIMRPIANLPYKQWDRKMKNPPPPPPRKAKEEWLYAKHHGLYQPTNEVDTSNPPKETGT